ncbi:mevalonate kinase [Bacteroidales bacterium 6E]|nr:mevalonate kinase [Bacteroidales bacterium 6E]
MKTFPAKILLFGEYSILEGSMALAIPYPSFSGFLKIDDTPSGKLINESGILLQGFCNFLKQKHTHFPFLDIYRFEDDIKKGLIFLSNIPQGYGLGSSGALTAAVYDHYKSQEIALTVTDLRLRLALMESFFHGTSSGLDPLVSYTGQPVMIGSEGNAVLTVGNQWQNLLKKSNAFLVDSKIVGKTEGFVGWFKEQMKFKNYAAEIHQRYTPAVNQAIESLTNGNIDDFLEAAKMVSRLQIKLLKPMIPTIFQPLFESGLSTNEYTLKLCGSGGGGYMLGFLNKQITRYWQTKEFPSDPIFLLSGDGQKN